MAYPYGLKYSTLTFSQPLAVSGQEADRTEITITPTRVVVWADSGRPIEEFTETVAAVNGQPGSVTAPFVDQSGFRDGSGQAVTNWAYRVIRTAWYGKQPRKVERMWAPLVGQDVVDFDLLPAVDPEQPGTVVAPQVLSVAGKTGAIGIDFLAERLTPWMDAKVAEGVDLDGLVPVVEAAVRDPNSGLRDAVDVRAQAAAAPKLDKTEAATTYAAKSVETTKLDADQRGTAGGVASLDEQKTVPVAELPEAVKTTTGGRPVAKGELVINVRDHGAVGDGVTDDTAAINTAIEAAIAAGKTVFIPSGTYVFNGYTNTGQGIHASIVGEAGKVPVLRATQTAVDAGNYMFMFNKSRYSTVAGLALAANIKPNHSKIALASVAGLSAGMVIQISSNRLWYNGHRNVYYCGEIHKITDVDTVAKTVTIEDFTRDVYSTTDTLTIRAWVPNKVSIKNLRIEAPYAATHVSSVGIALQQCADSIVENVSLQGFRNSMILENLCWNSRFINVKFEQDDKLDTTVGNGYGVESNGSVGTLVDGMYSKGLRRAFDAGSSSGTAEAAIARDWRVTNFIVHGGGAWYPNTAAINYGIGMHGSSENGVISNGFIEDCSNGVTARGRNTTVENVVFAGTLTSAVSLHENGAGLIVRNCTYDSFNYPNKLSSLADAVAGSGCNIFVQLGLTSGGVDGNCFYDLPIIIDGNVCKGLTSSFVQISQSTFVAKNLRVTNNHVEALAGTGNTFTTFHAPATATNLTNSVFRDNNEETVSGTVVTWGTNLVLAYRDATALKFMVDGTYYARIPTDAVVRIPRVAKAGQRIIVMFHADAGGVAFFRMVPENASIATVGAALPATIKGTATGSALTGTTGLVGEMTFGLMNNGDLWIENRATSVYTFRLTVQ